MRRTMFLLALIAALAGTPLRLAEAASALCESLAEVMGAREIEPPDGGIGDDAGAALKGDVLRVPLQVDEVVALVTPDILAPRTSSLSIEGRIHRPSERGGCVSERLALLQCFVC